MALNDTISARLAALEARISAVEARLTNPVITSLSTKDLHLAQGRLPEREVDRVARAAVLQMVAAGLAAYDQAQDR